MALSFEGNYKDVQKICTHHRVFFNFHLKMIATALYLSSFLRQYREYSLFVFPLVGNYIYKLAKNNKLHCVPGIDNINKRIAMWEIVYKVG